MLVIIIQAEQRYRMSVLGHERHDDYSFEFIHDNETHQEVVCIFGKLDAPSCYLTGRKW